MSSGILQAQDADKGLPNTAKVISKPSRDFVMLQFGYNSWLNKPDSVHLKSFGYTFGGFLCYDFPINTSHFSFATGLGVKVNVVYLDQQLLLLSDTSGKGYQARFVPDTVGYKRDKFVTTYLTAPFELRYFSNNKNRNKGFKAAAGLQIGTLLGAGEKGVHSVGGTVVKNKIDTKRFITSWDFAATARIGYGNVALYGSYNLTPVFKSNYGPAVTPFSVGITLTGL